MADPAYFFTFTVATGRCEVKGKKYTMISEILQVFFDEGKGEEI